MTHYGPLTLHGGVYSFFGLYAGLHLFYDGFKDLKLERLLGGTAVSKVRSLALGTVELAGAARPGDDPVRDPIYENPCLYYHVVVKEERGSGKNSHWVTIYDNASALPFYLEDDTGRILVYPGGADLYLEKTIDVHVGGLLSGDSDNQIEAFVGCLNGEGGRRHLVASFIMEKQDLCVYGFAGPDMNPAPSGPVFDDAIRQLKADPERMKALDKDGDGVVSPEEWDAGVAQLRKEWEAAQPVVPPPPIVVRKPQDGPLVISDKPMDRLASSLEWHSALKILGGPAIVIFCAVHIVRMFHFLAQ